MTLYELRQKYMWEMHSYETTQREMNQRAALVNAINSIPRRNTIKDKYPYVDETTLESVSQVLQWQRDNNDWKYVTG